MDAVFLAILQQFALKVHFLLCHVVYVDQSAHYALADELDAGFVALVKIDGAHECFEGIAHEVAVV